MALSPARRIITIAAVLGMFWAIMMMSRMASEPSLTLLYANLDPASAGEVVTALEGRGVAYDVRGNAIFVEAPMRDSLRMTLASEGLPANSAQGYELLDGLSGFGTTSQMFDAAYWRAKEGELARTLLANPNIRGARVHLAVGSGSPFQRDRRTTASVTLTAQGGGLSIGQANAVQYLIASAVPGLAPDDVAVIDSEQGLLSGQEDANGAATGADTADRLKQQVQRLLEARVGFGNAVVEISVEHVRDTETIVERRIDPDSRVAISSEVQESTNQSTNQSAGGGVTVASNLPDGEAGGEGQSASDQGTETRETTNYEVSETQREILRGPGAVSRVTVAVLVNGVTETDAAGVVTSAPRSDEELAALEELVASAVGFDETRGDVITIKSMSFEPLAAQGTEAVAEAGLFSGLDIMQLIQIAILAVVALILGLFVVRPVLSANGAANEADTLSLPSPGGLDDDEGFGGLPDLPMMGDFDLGDSEPDPAERLRELIEERKDETVQVLRDWIETPDAKEVV